MTTNVHPPIELKANALIHEKSPYLLQHAYNPVDWHPWNENTLKLAKQLKKPIFLSIGYSTCYWCHVMEREVFENPEIAKLMNKYFINIKVDREERPDIDRIYMMALQSMTGAGGWPMSMFLTTDLKPFYGATYIPPKAKYGRAGFEDIIGQVNELWNTKQNEILESSNEIYAHLEKRINSVYKKDEIINDMPAKSCYELCRKIFDYENGGFGEGNKFPRTSVLDFLLAYNKVYKDIEALDMVTYTCQKMFLGGIYDHLGGGFHRYSVDTIWRVPHFEKMLYDQAQLICTYIDAYLVSDNKLFLSVAEDTAKFILNNLASSEGAFYSAEDAESATDADKPHEKAEGAYNLWSKEELDKILGDDAEIFNCYFGILPHGNTLNDPHEVFGNKNVLYIANDVFDTAKKFDKTPEEISETISSSTKKLLEVRNKRPAPHLDDKILTSWNALTIKAFCKLYQVTGNNEYLNIAKKATAFIQEKLFDKKNKTLLHRFREGESKFTASLEDYAYLIDALINLYESSFDVSYLEFAIEINEITINKFYDKTNSGFFDTEINDDIILRTKEIYDGAEPSGNAIQIQNLLKLGVITGKNELTDMAVNSIKLFFDELQKYPFSYPCSISDLMFYLNSAKEIIITGGDDKSKELLNQVYATYLPFRIILKADKNIEKISSFINNKTFNFEESKVYVCKNYKCELPVSNIEELNNLLKN
ncbi:MAG TPA: thioredoxin domain-containing protein [Ignavibacteria bacterium]|nr:thioredoxin domain-containing protein [Ignavibacteria bacterium]